MNTTLLITSFAFLAHLAASNSPPPSIKVSPNLEALMQSKNKGFIYKTCKEGGPFRKNKGQICSKDPLAAATFLTICAKNTKEIQLTKCYTNIEKAFGLKVVKGDPSHAIAEPVFFTFKVKGQETPVGSYLANATLKGPAKRVLCQLMKEPYYKEFIRDKAIRDSIVNQCH